MGSPHQDCGILLDPTFDTHAITGGQLPSPSYSVQDGGQIDHLIPSHRPLTLCWCLFPQINGAPARGPDHFPFQGIRDSGIGSQGIINSLDMMTKVKTTVLNLDKPSYTMG